MSADAAYAELAAARGLAQLPGLDPGRLTPPLVDAADYVLPVYVNPEDPGDFVLVW